jgi:hypothetical protein
MIHPDDSLMDNQQCKTLAVHSPMRAWTMQPKLRHGIKGHWPTLRSHRLRLNGSDILTSCRIIGVNDEIERLHHLLEVGPNERHGLD